MNIRDIIQSIVKETLEDSKCRVAKVLSVDGYTCTVETLDTETEISDVRLQAESSNGILLKPKVGSFVIIAPYADFEYVVIMYSAADEIKLLDGSFGGLVKVAALTDKMNAIESKVNDVISFINTHSHASNGAPPSPTFTGGTLTETQRSDIENDKVTHGDI
jgi:hypothetical protein